MERAFKRDHKTFKVFMAAAALLLVAAIALSTSLAWFGAQNKRNNFVGTPMEYTLVLKKIDSETSAALSGAEFYLYRAGEAGAADTQIGAKMTTDANGLITVENLPAGSYYFIEKRPTEGYGFIQENGSPKTRFDVELSKNTAQNGVVTVEVKNVPLKGSLVVTKTVVNADNSPLTDGQQTKEFFFTVTFSDGQKYPYTKNGDSSVTYQLEDDGTLILRHGEWATFDGLSTDILYTVVEKDYSAEGYVTTSLNNSNHIAQNGSIAAFTNTYGTGSETGSLTVKKTLLNTPLNPEDTFTFTVLFSDGKKYPYRLNGTGNLLMVSAENTFTLKGGQTAVFSGIPLDVGYEVTEAADIRYTQGLTKQTGVIVTGGITAEFRNEYITTEDKGGLTITKKTAGTDTPPAEGFAFTVTFSDGEKYPYTLNDEQQSRTLGDGGRVMLQANDTIRFADVPAGVQYTVTELTNETPEWALINGTAARTGSIAPNAVISEEFLNKKPGGPAGFGTLQVAKVLSGNATSTSDEFTFAISFSDGNMYSYRVPARAGAADSYTPQRDSVTNVYTFTLKGGETAVFEQIPSDVSYEVTELGNSLGYTLAGNPGARTGTIAADAVLTEQFVNVKNITPPRLGKLTITKEVRGGASASGDAFTFAVTFANGENYSYLLNGTGTPIQMVNGTLTLHDGESAVFESVPSGIGYRVEEQPAQGYIQGVMVATGVINSDERVTFVNVKKDDPPVNGEIVITKTTEGLGADLTKAFEMSITVTGNEGEEYSISVNGASAVPIKSGVPFTFSLANGQSARLTKLTDGAHYVFEERNYRNEGYIQTAVISGTGTVVAGRVIEVSKTNTYIGRKKIEINGEKKWEGTATYPESITVQLYDNINQRLEEEKTIQPDASGKWTFSFTADEFDEHGNAVAYLVKEKEIEGFLLLQEGTKDNGYQLINKAYAPTRLDPPVVVKTVTGVNIPNAWSFSFTMEAVGSAPMPEGSVNGVKTLLVTNASTPDDREFGWIEYTSPGTYTYRIREVNSGASNVNYDPTIYTLEVKVVSDAQGNLSVNSATLASSASTEVKNIIKDGTPTAFDTTIEYTNEYVPTSELISIDVSKRFVGIEPTDPHYPASVQVQLYRNGVPEGDAVTLNEGNGWSHKWNNLDKNAQWRVDEVAVPQGFAKRVTGTVEEGFVITNTYSKITDLTVTKDWQNDTASNRPASIQVQLYKDGAAEGAPVTLESGTGWTYTWSGLDTAHEWTVDETSVPAGYVKKSVTETSAYNFTITNSYEPGGSTKQDISVKKTWPGVSENDKVEVQVQLYKGNASVGAPITLNRKNNWSYTWKGLEKGASWRVDEVRVPTGFTKKVTGSVDKGFVIANSYNRPKIPQTGQLWWPAMLLALAGVITIAIGVVMRRRRNQYEK